MSHKNVEVVRRGYEAANRLDFEAWLDGFHPDVQFHELPTIPDAPVYRGHDGLRRWAEMTMEVWGEDRRYEPEAFTTAADFVIAEVRIHASGRRSGARVDRSVFHVFQMRDGKVRRVWAFSDESEARKAAGLDG